MTEFVVGDRVRVRGQPGTAAYAGRSGTVVGAERDDATGAGVLCQVRLKGDPTNIPFLADELE